MFSKKIILITGTRKGIGEHLANHYLEKECFVIGCSRKESELKHPNYEHHCVDIVDEKAVRKMFAQISKKFGNWISCSTMPA